MQTIDIHGNTVKINEDSDSARYAVEYLNKLSDGEAEVFFDAAKRDLINHLSHFETPHDGEHHNLTHHMTLIHNSDGSYELRKKLGY